MRGRVVALYIMAFMGSTAIGGPLVGVAGQVFGPRASLGVGAAGCLAAVVLALAYGRARAARSARRVHEDLGAGVGGPLVRGRRLDRSSSGLTRGYAASSSSAWTRRLHSALSSRQPSSVRERFQ